MPTSLQKSVPDGRSWVRKPPQNCQIQRVAGNKKSVTPTRRQWALLSNSPASARKGVPPSPPKHCTRNLGVFSFLLIPTVLDFRFAGNRQSAHGQQRCPHAFPLLMCGTPCFPTSPPNFGVTAPLNICCGHWCLHLCSADDQRGWACAANFNPCAQFISTIQADLS